MEASAPKLDIVHVSKEFVNRAGDRIPVIDDLTFSVPNLEFLVLLGPSGCGKSTLLKILDGLTGSDGGSIRLDGRDVTQRGIGHAGATVFQGFDLFPWRTVRGNVEFGLELRGASRSERRQRASHYIDLVGLRGFEDTYPAQLSGGMQQRVGTARALAVDPEVLLMDEPFGALDVQTRDVLQDELLRIWQQERKTVLFVTHSIEEALYLADRILVFSPRPARIETIIDVPFPRPRGEMLKSDPDFLAMRRDIWRSLKQGVKV